MADPESVSFSIRMPRALRDELDRAAQAESVSTAKQIIRLLEAGLKGGASSDPALAPLARQIAEAERLTGKDWRDDVQTYGAARTLIERWIDGERPRPLNFDEIVAKSDKFKDADSQLKGTLASLEAAGVIRRTTKSVEQMFQSKQPNALAGLLGRNQSPPPTKGNPKLNIALLAEGYELMVDSEDEAVNWDLQSPDLGGPMDDDQKLGFKAVLAMVVPFFERANKLREDYINAWSEDDAALEAGKSLVVVPTRGL